MKNYVMLMLLLSLNILTFAQKKKLSEVVIKEIPKVNLDSTFFSLKWRNIGPFRGVGL